MSDLTYGCLRIRSVNSGKSSLNYDLSIDEVCTVQDACSTDVTVVYEYLPDDLTLLDLDNQVPVDARSVDPCLLADYANYQFLSENGTAYDSALAATWLGLFNDGFENIMGVGTPKRVRYNG